MNSVTDKEPARVLQDNGIEIAEHVITSSFHSFRDKGYISCGDLWSSGFSALLASEAADQRAHAVLPVSGPRTPVAKSRIPPRRTLTATGTLLTRLSSCLVPSLRALTGRVLIPSFAGYGYYEDDERVVLHRDLPEHALTLLISPQGKIGPLHLHLNLIGSSMEDLGRLESDPQWDTHTGLQVQYPTNGFFAFLGRDIPHHRPAKPVEGSQAVGALCYKDLFGQF